MLISFVGGPASGKTTTAAMVFSRLKELGSPVEFIYEQARIHIAKKKFKLGLKPEDKLILTDEDQIHILSEQRDLENIMSQACGDKVNLISDSSTLNSLLYMSEEILETEIVKTLVKDSVSRYDLVFYAPLVKISSVLDPNRVHNEQESIKVNDKIPSILNRFAPGLKVIELAGDPKYRERKVISEIMNKLVTG